MIRAAVFCARLWLATAILVGVSFAGEPPTATNVEITYLLSAVRTSGCQFYRNGTWYGSGEAASHLGRKYQYLLDRGLVSSPEAFIEKAASESSLSGQAYQVKCGSGPAVKSADWLRAELEKYRRQSH